MRKTTGNSRSKWILGLLGFVCIAPFVIALVLYSNRFWLTGTSQHSTLIQPAIPVDRAEFVGFDRFSRENISEIQGAGSCLHSLARTDVAMYAGSL